MCFRCLRLRIDSVFNCALILAKISSTHKCNFGPWSLEVTRSDSGTSHICVPPCAQGIFNIYKHLHWKLLMIIAVRARAESTSMLIFILFPILNWPPLTWCYHYECTFRQCKHRSWKMAVMLAQGTSSTGLVSALVLAVLPTMLLSIQTISDARPEVTIAPEQFSVIDAVVASIISATINNKCVLAALTRTHNNPYCCPRGKQLYTHFPHFHFVELWYAFWVFICGWKKRMLNKRRHMYGCNGWMVMVNESRILVCCLIENVNFRSKYWPMVCQHWRFV